MAVGRAERRAQRDAIVHAVFGAELTDSALDLLEVVDMAWHDVYGDVCLPDDVLADVLVLSSGGLQGLISATHLALSDWRDLRVSADRFRASRGPLG